jgi:hypothetical protein
LTFAGAGTANVASGYSQSAVPGALGLQREAEVQGSFNRLILPEDYPSPGTTHGAVQIGHARHSSFDANAQ